VLVRDPARADAHRALTSGVVPTADLDAFLAARPELVVEAAGHGALVQAGPATLRAGIDLLVASVGALADPAIEQALRAAARAGGARIRIPSGALGGLDALGAARLAGLDEVTYVSRKPPAAWRGTAAESLVDLAAVREPTVFLATTAREAARRFPQNANVAAAVGLAGIGLDRTRVELMVDPQVGGNRHRILARGAFGELDVSVEARVLPDNPKSSRMAPMSLLAALAREGAELVIG
jgi:aspartate dehydrogenase